MGIFNFHKKVSVPKNTQTLGYVKLSDIHDKFFEIVDEGAFALLSATDIAKRYGRTNKFWDREMAFGRLKCYKMSSGKFTTNLFVLRYLKEDEGISETQVPN